MPLSYYICYRVQPAKFDVLEERVQEMQAAIHRAGGVAGRLVKGRDDPLLWMEVYEGVDDAAKFEKALAQAVARYQMEGILAPGSRRQCECFSDA